MPSLVTCMTSSMGKDCHLVLVCLLCPLLSMSTHTAYSICGLSPCGPHEVSPCPKGLYVRPEPIMLQLVLLIRVPDLDNIVNILPV